ncbi:unnamed protein product [Amoebophrya sp. A120]|nr:unnamed protein product [Amoebophrya sp. A120]|eukprot:GSA120T00022767001.1
MFFFLFFVNSVSFSRGVYLYLAWNLYCYCCYSLSLYTFSSQPARLQCSTQASI